MGKPNEFVPVRLDQRCETPTIANRRAHLDNDIIVFRHRLDDTLLHDIENSAHPTSLNKELDTLKVPLRRGLAIFRLQMLTLFT